MLPPRSITMGIVLTLGAAGGCSAGDRTVPGPEAKDLLKGTAGYIVHTPMTHLIGAVSLTDLKERVVRAGGPRGVVDSPTIHSVSGPDHEGRIAYIEDYFFVKNEANRRHLLKIIRIDGSGDTALFTRPGDALWATSAGNGAIGHQLALSPTGGKVAFLSGLSDKQMPGALFEQGTIELWDIVVKKRLPLTATGVDQPLSWFPDGRNLACVRFIARTEVPKTGVPVEQFGMGDYTGSWTELPAVYILDTQTGNSRFLSLGWQAVISWDGKSAFVGGCVYDARERTKLVWKRVDIATGAAGEANWLGDAGGIIANPAKDLVLYWGLPTTGATIQHSPYGSFHAGLMLVTIKAALLNSGRFQTVVPEIDPRERISFGQIVGKR